MWNKIAGLVLVSLWPTLTAAQPVTEWEVGERVNTIVQIPVPGNSSDSNPTILLAEIELEARPDLPFRGTIDRDHQIVTPDQFRSTDYPWVLRTMAMSELIRYRAFLKAILESYGEIDVDYRLPWQVSAHFPPESFPEFDVYAEELARKGKPDEDPSLKDRFRWLLLGHAFRLSELDHKIRETSGSTQEGDAYEDVFSTNPAYESSESVPTVGVQEEGDLLKERARLSAEAPRILEVGYRVKTFERRKSLLNRLDRQCFSEPNCLSVETRQQLESFEQFFATPEDLPEFSGELKSTVDAAVLDALMFALAENGKAIQALAQAREEKDVDPLLNYFQLHSLAMSSYPSFEKAFELSAKRWAERADKRAAAERKNSITSATAGLGLLLVSGFVPYLGFPLAAGKVAAFGGTAIFGMDAWGEYWKAHAVWSLERATYAGSELLMTTAEYIEARKAYGTSVVSSLATAVFFLPGLASVGRISLITRAGPKAMGALLAKLDGWAVKAESSQALYWRSRMARFAITNIERVLGQIARTRPYLAKDAADALARRPVVFQGLQFHWSSEAAKTVRATKDALPPIFTFSHPGELLKATAADFQKAAASLRSLESGSTGFFQTAGRAVATSLSNPTNRRLAATMIGTNTVLKWAIEASLRDGDVWEDEKLFGLIPRPKTGILINITIGNIVLGTMAFVTHVKNPLLKAIPPALVTGTASSLSQLAYTGHIDAKRVGVEVGYNMVATWFLLPPQMHLAQTMAAQGAGPGTSYLLYRASWTATGFVVSRTHSKLMLTLFEHKGEKRDRFGNVVESSDTSSVYRLPKGPAPATKVADSTSSPVH